MLSMLLIYKSIIDIKMSSSGCYILKYQINIIIIHNIKVEVSLILYKYNLSYYQNQDNFDYELGA